MALPHIVAARIVIDTDILPEERITHTGMGPAADLQLRSCLQQISLRGYMDTLLEQLGGWDLPSLCCFSVDSSPSHPSGTTQDPQDLVEFLKHHGSNLDLLDLNLKNSADVPLILDLCPNLHTFAFNADWHIRAQNNMASNIVNRPHQHITTIGLHGLSYAFGVGIRYSQAMVNHRLEANFILHSNDLNITELNKSNFPKLHCIRALNRGMLEDLNMSNGPSESGYDRWSKWWSACVNNGIQLEDCTGQPLGTLPKNSDGEEDSDEESEDGVEGGESEEESGEESGEERG